MTTPQRSLLADAYLRFLQLARAMESGEPGNALMDANESVLLEALVLRWHEGRPMTVREAIHLSALGSPATLHKRISRLREKNLLLAHTEPGDRRAKYLMPTQLALDHYDQLGRSMQRVQQLTQTATPLAG